MRWYERGGMNSPVTRQPSPLVVFPSPTLAPRVEPGASVVNGRRCPRCPCKDIQPDGGGDIHFGTQRIRGFTQRGTGPENCDPAASHPYTARRRRDILGTDKSTHTLSRFTSGLCAGRSLGRRIRWPRLGGTALLTKFKACTLLQWLLLHPAMRDIMEQQRHPLAFHQSSDRMFDGGSG